MVFSNYLILSTSWEPKLVFELVDGSVGRENTSFWIAGLGGGDGKANTTKYKMGNGAFLGGKLEIGGIINFSWSLPKKSMYVMKF